MRAQGLTAGLLAAVGIFVWSGVSRAGDTIRLNMVDQAPAQNLVDDGQGADTIRTWHHGFGWGGYGWGGYRGFGWGGYRGFGYGGFYRPYYGFGLGYGGLYRPFGLGFGRFGYGLGYGGLGYGLGFGGLGYGWGGYRFGFGGMYPGFGFGYGGLFGPCAGATAGSFTLNIPSANVGTPLPGAPAAPPQAPAEETFPYDGGPANPVPQANDAPAPTSNPRQRSVPLEGRSVSLPRAAPKWGYPAYGETARRTTRVSDRTYLTRDDAKKSDAR